MLILALVLLWAKRSMISCTYSRLQFLPKILIQANLEGAYSSVNLYNSKTVQILMLCLFQKSDTFFAQCVYFISDLDFLSIDSKLSIFWASRKPIIGQWYVDSNHNNWWLLLGYCYKYKIMIHLVVVFCRVKNWHFGKLLDSCYHLQSL